jgi:hypothetical protein
MKMGRPLVAAFVVGLLCCAEASAAPFTPEPGSPLSIPGLLAGSAFGNLRAADFTGDGTPDLGLALLNEKAVATFVGDGVGGFTSVPGSPFVAGDDRVAGFAFGDFDENGVVDLVAGAQITDPVTFLHGHDNGVFDAPVVSTAIGRPTELAAGYLDGDAHLDLAATNAVTNSLAFTMLIGDGHGAFAATSVPIALTPARVAIADFDGDGVSDVAAMNNASLQVAFGDRGATPPFTNGVLMAIPSPATAFAIADLNGDGLADVATASRDASGTVSVRLSDGHRAFAPQPTLTMGSGANGIVAADFNRDGKLDLAVTLNSAERVAILLGDGTGRFTPMPDSPITVPGGPTALVAADFDGDGYPDLATALATAKTIAVLHNGYAPEPPAPAAATPAPVIDALAPATGSVDGGETVTIAGQNLGSLRQVWFGDVPATSFRVERFDRITAVAPPHAAGLVGVRVETSAGSSDVAAYRYVEAPAPETTTPITPTATRPEGTVTTSAAACTVPALKGLRLSAARERLRKAGCALGRVHRVRGSRGAKVERVTRQSVAAGRSEAHGRHVAVTVKRVRR